MAAPSKAWVCGRSLFWDCGFEFVKVGGWGLGGWQRVFCECCVLSGRSLSIPRPEESYRLVCVWSNATI